MNTLQIETTFPPPVVYFFCMQNFKSFSFFTAYITNKKNPWNNWSMLSASQAKHEFYYKDYHFSVQWPKF